MKGNNKRTWRDEIRQLDGFPLLPCGAGNDYKAPLVSGWPNKSYSLEEVLAFDRLRCIGMRCGPDAGGLLVLDFDGASAMRIAVEEFGVNINVPITWTIGRNTNPNRFKAVYRIPQERWEGLPGKTMLSTGDGEQLEFFWSSGQVIVAGEHVKSGGEYRWPSGSPDDIKPIPEVVWCMWQNVIQRNPPACSRRSTDGRQINDWQDCIPCPICDRQEPDCRISENRKAVLCHWGSRWSPPVVAKGEKIERPGRTWQYVEDKTLANGKAALFRLVESQLELNNQKTVNAGEALLRMSEALGDSPLFNVRTHGIHCKDHELTADEVDNFYLTLSRGKYNWQKSICRDALITLARKTPFDEVMVYLDNLNCEALGGEQWNRLDQFLFGVDDLITARFMQRFLVAAVARVLKPGCLVRQVPVLLGPQNIGKTELGRALFSHDLYGDGLTSKLDVDSVTAMALCWAVEFAEFSGFARETSAEKLKAFISRRTDIVRRKYAKGTERIERRSVFWGTTNKSPLCDSSGSSRFVMIPLPNAKLPIDRVQLNRDQLWKRALVEYHKGFQWFSTEAEMDEILSRNAGYEMEDPWSEIVGDYLKSRSGAAYILLYEIFDHLQVPSERQSGKSANRIRELAEYHGWEKQRRRIGHDRVHAFWPVARPTRA